MPIEARARRLPAAARWTLLAWAPMLLWYAAFRPGIMSADSLLSWEQAAGRPWADFQPPAYTAAMWVSRLLLGSPSLLTLGQSLLLAGGFVALGRALVRVGARPRVVVVALGILVASPMVGAFSVSLWKDVPYTGISLLVGARLLDLAAARERDDRPATSRALLLVVAWSLPAVLLRQNGILVFGALLVILTIVLRGHRRQAAAGAVACVAALGVAKFVVYPALGVQAGPPNSEVSTMLHDVAAVAAADPDALDRSDVELLEEIAPVEVWAGGFRSFSCRSANWQFDSRFERWEAIEGRQDRFVSLWAELAAENPRAVLENRLCVGAIAWDPWDEGLVYTVSRGIDDNELGLRTEPVLGALTDPARELLDQLDRRVVQQVAWRAPLWIYAAYGVGAFVARRRGRPWLLLPLVPLAATQLAVAGLNPAQDARYMLPAMFLAIGMLTTWTVPSSAPRPDAATEDRTPQPVAVGVAPAASPPEDHP